MPYVAKPGEKLPSASTKVLSESSVFGMPMGMWILPHGSSGPRAGFAGAASAANASPHGHISNVAAVRHSIVANVRLTGDL
ncbi:MAG: hypothetical protein NT049_11170, partial [Planctomycetota bacterium]|nr:hypothetical protein [Planctomycetota bacterium]